MQGVPFDKLRGTAVVVYAEPLTTQQMLYHRFSRKAEHGLCHVLPFSGHADRVDRLLSNRGGGKRDSQETAAFLSICLAVRYEGIR
jgi:hypothetical protein